MKKISKYLFILCVGLLAVSCVEPLSPQPGISGDNYSISLSVLCCDPETKATKPGVENPYHENTLNRIDYFVFKDNTTVAIDHGRAPINNDNVIEDVTIGLDNAVTGNGISGKVYVIANLPTATFRHQDGSFQKLGNDGQTWENVDLTMAALQALEVNTAFDALNSGKFKAQDEFVMTGEKTFELTASARVQDCEVPLSRRAAKITLDLGIVPAIDEIITLPNGQTTYTKTWYPDLNNIQIYLSYADMHTTLAGTPETYVAQQFRTYNRDAFLAEVNPTFVQLPANDQRWDNGFEWNVTGSPFYTYPMEWETSSPTAPFIKIIVPWTPYDESEDIQRDPYTGEFIRAGRAHSKPYEGMDTQLFYYKIALPSENVTSTKALQLLANEWYKLAMSVTILGGTSDDLPLELAGQYYIVDWSNPDFSAGGALRQGRYLSVARDTFYIYGGNSITIPVQSSHDLSVTCNSATYFNLYYNDGAGRTENLANNNYSVVANGRESFTLTHNLNNDITSSNVDVSTITYKVTVNNEAGLSTKPITIIQQPSLFIEKESSNKYVFINANSNHASSGWQTVGWGTQAYKLIYDDGGAHQTSGNYNLPFSNNNTNSFSNSDGIQIALNNVSNYSTGYYSQFRGKRIGSSATNSPGTITVSAPTGGYITKITLTYYNNMSSQPVTYVPEGTSPSKTTWEGEEPSVVISMPYDNNNPNVVTTVNVDYSYISTATEKLGALKHYNYDLDNNRNYNIYTVNVTDISSNNYGWYISDPRVTEGVTYNSLKGGSSSGSPLSGYLPVSKQNANAIAPQIKIASSAGASIYSDNDYSRMNYDQATRRCASYQENGYPAGRWRIPTDAEIRFIILLSTNNKIPSLFNGKYWAASGNILDDGGNITTSNNGASVRCVYDSWYWGDRPENQTDWPAAGYTTSWLTNWSGWQN